MHGWVEVAPGVVRVEDTCHVYLILDRGPAETTAVAIDFGAGRALDLLAELGVARITDVLMTHHHRDQGQGLPRAVAHGARIHVPPTEIDLFRDVEELWRTRTLDNDYNLRQDRFSLLESVPVHDVVPVYRELILGGVRVHPVPLPGHTLGSVGYLLERDGQRIAFTGDLIHSPGRVWSLAATQWTYTENEGPAMVVLSCLSLIERHPNLLLPSHGAPMDAPEAALELLVERMQRYVDSRRPAPWDLRAKWAEPYRAITPHVLLNAESMSCGYVLLSDTGAAMLIDFGYDMFTGLIGGGERSSRLPWLASLPALRRDFGVTRIEVALPTHYHDDHIAGMPLLREVEGTEIWAPANVAPILRDPLRHDLPCLWWDPVPVDRELPLGESFTWHEHTITVHPLPGHTLYAAAFEIEVDGVRLLFTGDQQTNEGSHLESQVLANYQYRNRFRIGDYRDSAALYRRIAPGLLLSGHWQPLVYDEVAAAELDALGEAIVARHEELLPLAELDLDPTGAQVRIEPYRSVQRADVPAQFTARLANPVRDDVIAVLEPVVPIGWRSDPPRVERPMGPGESAEVEFTVVPGPGRGRRHRIAVDISFGEVRLGQQAEAIIDVE